jgi:hypothetical protein
MMHAGDWQGASRKREGRGNSPLVWAVRICSQSGGKNICDRWFRTSHSKWRTKEFYAPYLYGGIRADFAKFLGIELEKAHPIFDDIVDAMMNPAPTIWADYIKETEDDYYINYYKGD